MSQYSLLGIRQIITMAGEPVFLKKQADELEAILGQKPEMEIDFSRAIIETMCQTILNDRGITIEKTWFNNTPQLFDNTLVSLPVEQISDKKTELALNTIIQGLKSLVSGICQLRNKVGMGSHGKDAYTPSINPLLAELTVRVTDCLVYFLYKLHKSYPPDLSKKRLFLHQQPDFNQYLDDSGPVIEILGMTYTASQVLFSTDETAYREALIEFRAQNPEPSEDI
jgi:hypothetical protein